MTCIKNTQTPATAENKNSLRLWKKRPTLLESEITSLVTTFGLCRVLQLIANSLANCSLLIMTITVYNMALLPNITNLLHFPSDWSARESSCCNLKYATIFWRYKCEFHGNLKSTGIDTEEWRLLNGGRLEVVYGSAKLRDIECATVWGQISQKLQDKPLSRYNTNAASRSKQVYLLSLGFYTGFDRKEAHMLNQTIHVK